MLARRQRFQVTGSSRRAISCRTTCVQAVEAHSRLKDDEGLSCFYLGADGHGYGGGPEGCHPDC